MQAVAAFFASFITFVSGFFGSPLLASNSPINVPTTRLAAAGTAQTEIVGDPFDDLDAASPVAEPYAAASPAPASPLPPHGRVLGEETTNLAPFLSQFSTFLRSFDAYLASPFASGAIAYPRYGGYVPSTGGTMIGTVPANTALAAPVITGGSITNASSGSFDALSAGTLSVSGAATFGTVTIASTNASSSNITDLTSTNATTTNLAISSLSHSLLAADQTGRVIATSTISWNLIRGTANSIFAFDATGNPIATTTIGSGYITGTLGTINGTTFNRGDALSITAASSTLLANNNTFSGSNIFLQPLSLTSTTGTTTIATGQGFTIGGSQFVVQQGSGNVGIGTTSPAGSLAVSMAGGPTANANYYGVYSSVVGGSNSNNIAGYFHAASNSTNYAIYSDAGNIFFNGSLNMNNNAISNIANIQAGGTPDPSWGTITAKDTTSGFAAGQGGQLVFCGDERGQGGCWATFAMIKGIKENSNYLDALGALTFHVRDVASTGTQTSGLIEKMRLTSSGYLGIGTTTPWGLLSVVSADNASAPPFVVGSSTATSLIVRANGNVGIGTTTPWGKLSITGSGTGTGLAFAVADSANTPRFVIQDNGNVGIGTTTPGSLLSLNNIANFTTATSTFYSTGGVSLAAGCFAKAGNCLSFADLTGTLDIAQGGTGTTTQVTNGVNYFDGTRITSGSGLTFTGTNLGIGTGTPAAKLDIYGGTLSTTHTTSYSWTMNNSEANASNWQISNMTGAGNAGGLRFYNGTNAAEYLRITNAGTTIVKGGLSMSGDAPMSATFDGCGCSSLMWHNVAATAASSTEPEIGAQFNMNSNIGLANAASAYKIGLTSSVDGGANSARIYALNTIARGYAGAGGYLITGIESDVDNNGADATTLGSSTAAYGMVSVAGGGPGKSTAGYWSTAVNDGSWTYGFASSGTINTSAFYDASNAQSILSAVGSHTNGIDISGATISGNEFKSPSFLVKGNGQVGVDTTNIVGNLTVSAGTDRMLNFRGDPASFGTSQGGIILQGVNSAQTASAPVTITGSALYLNPNGANLGLGTTTPTAQLHTTGTVRFSNFGAGTLTTDASGNLSVSSDERLKNIDGAFTRGLADIVKLSPIQYHWNPLSGLDTRTQYAGFSAQNVEQVIPEAVGSSTNGYLTLQDRPLIAAAVNAIKELSAKLDTLHAAVSGFAERFATRNLCIEKSDGSNVCITGDQLAALLSASGGSYTITTSNQPAPPFPEPDNNTASDQATSTPPIDEQPATSTPSTDTGISPPQTGDAPPRESSDPSNPPEPSNDNPPPIDSADEGGVAPTEQQDAA